MRSRIVAFGALALAFWVASPGGALADKVKTPRVKVSLEGTWKVKVTPDAAAAAKGEKEFDDTLILLKGKFRSSACEATGFAEAPYRVDGSHWMSDVVSEKEGKNHWHGEVSGDSVSGQMTWTKSDGSVLNYTITGTRAGDQPQTRKGKKSQH